MNLPLSLFLDLVRMSRQRVKALVAGRRARRAVQPAHQQQEQQLQMPLLLYDEYDDQVAFEPHCEVWDHGITQALHAVMGNGRRAWALKAVKPWAVVCHIAGSQGVCFSSKLPAKSYTLYS
jgi:hypothetical protein